MGDHGAMRLLLPEPIARVDDSDLLRLYSWPAEQVLVRANMVSTIDGAISGSGGTSGSISSQADKRVFHLLRGMSDAIIVGAGTVIAENYGPVPHDARLAVLRTADGQLSQPVICIVSNRASVPPEARVFEGTHGSSLVIVSPAADPQRVSALREVTEVMALGEAGSGQVETAMLPRLLAERGLRRQLIEGGPTLLGAMAGLMHELCLTTSPLLVGATTDAVGTAGSRILSGKSKPIDRAATLAHLLEADGTLMSRWLLK